jgi:hypothetical protein
MILTRADLARAASDLDLGLRAGERRFALKALLSQDGARVVDWLRGDALRWAARHRRHATTTGIVGNDWETRARRTAERLEALSKAQHN